MTICLIFSHRRWRRRSNMDVATGLVRAAMNVATTCAERLAARLSERRAALVTESCGPSDLTAAMLAPHFLLPVVIPVRNSTTSPSCIT